jgi:hypothetical protein
VTSQQKSGLPQEIVECDVLVETISEKEIIEVVETMSEEEIYKMLVDKALSL